MEDDNDKKRGDEMIPIVPLAVGGVAKAVEVALAGAAATSLSAGRISGKKLDDNMKDESLSATSEEEKKEEQAMETNRNGDVEQVNRATESHTVGNPKLDMKQGKIMPSSKSPKFIAVRLEIFAAVLANKGETDFLRFPMANALFEQACGELFTKFMGGIRPRELARDDKWRDSAFCEWKWKSQTELTVRTKLPAPTPHQSINHKMFDFVEAIVFAGKTPLEEIDYDLIAKKFGSSRQYALLYTAFANRNRIRNTPGCVTAKPGSLVAIAQDSENNDELSEKDVDGVAEARGDRSSSGRSKFFVGVVKEEKTSLLRKTNSYVVTDAITVLAGGSKPSPCPDIPIAGGSLNDGEFVVGIYSKEPHLFCNQTPAAAVQVVSWSSFKEAERGQSAEEYFSRNTSGVLAATSPFLLGNPLNPGHVIVVDGPTYLKGFLSMGNGEVAYSAVEVYSGDFGTVVKYNQGMEFGYKDDLVGILVPPPYNPYRSKGRHSVIDCDGWVPLNKSEPTLKVPETQLDDVGPDVTGGDSAQTKAMADDSETIRIAQTESNGVVSPRYEDALKQSEPALKAPETQSDDAGADVVDGYSAQTKAMTGGGEKSGVNILVPPPRRESAAVGQDPEELKFVAKLIRVAGESGFDYDPRDLVRFHTSVKVGGFTVLGGLPGCGKSSLVALYARALLGKNKLEKSDSYLTIDVSPSWMEPEDVLGHWGLKDHYVPAKPGLVEFLRRAVSVGDDRFPTMPIVCLEEMNLARVEHYFADFMQQLCRSEDERGLRGVPESDGQENPSEAFLPLSPSLRFVGTNNFDQTTQRFSPRFYDRSNYIELVDSRTSEPFSKGVPSYLNADFGSQVERTTYESWFNKEPSHDILEQAVVDKYKSLTEVFKKVNLPVSRRAEVAILVYVANRPFLSECGDDLSDQIACQMRALDEVIAQKILSRYTGSSYGGDTESEKQLKEKIADLPLSRELVINRSKGRERPSRL